MLFVMLLGAGVGGFAFSQWISESERSAQTVLQHELQARVEENEPHRQSARGDASRRSRGD